MITIGIPIGKTRLAEVVQHASAVCGDKPVRFGVSIVGEPNLESLHYDWASCCNQRLFAVDGDTTSLPAIFQNMFDEKLPDDIADSLDKDGNFSAAALTEWLKKLPHEIEEVDEFA